PRSVAGSCVLVMVSNMLGIIQSECWREICAARALLPVRKRISRGSTHRQESLHPIARKPRALGTPVPVPHKNGHACDFLYRFKAMQKIKPSPPLNAENCSSPVELRAPPVTAVFIPCQHISR